MNQKNAGVPAFPVSYNPDCQTEIVGGMTLRDCFAGKALPGVIAAIMQNECHNWSSEDFAREAYGMADAMISERNRRAEPNQADAQSQLTAAAPLLADELAKADQIIGAMLNEMTVGQKRAVNNLLCAAGVSDVGMTRANERHAALASAGVAIPERVAK